MILFIGGYWCYHNFQKYIERIFKEKNKDVLFRVCIEVKQEDIDKCNVIIAYSYAIQFIHKMNLDNKKVILLSPLLNNEIYKDNALNIANKLSSLKLTLTNIGIELYLMKIGASRDTLHLWRQDILDFIDKYGVGMKHIENVKVKNDWLIFEGIKPISKLPFQTGKITDDKGNLSRHILNYSNHLLFLDKYLV